MAWLLLLFVAVPALELALLIRIGEWVGTPATLALIVVTGVVGASLARRQGVGVLARLQSEMRAGRLPAGSLLDGAFILVAAALLVTPGLLTDAVGFLLLVPPVRDALKAALRRRLERAVREQRLVVRVYDEDPWGPREEKVVRDVDDPLRHETDAADTDAAGREPPRTLH